METKETKTIASPDVLLEDPDSKCFYILKDETVALCKFRDELPYHKNRQTYLASGRFSPQFKAVVFWPGSINTSRAVQLLIENNHIDAGYSVKVSGATTSIKSEPTKKGPMGIERHGSVRRAEIDHMIRKGFRVQEKQKSQPEE